MKAVEERPVSAEPPREAGPARSPAPPQQLADPLRHVSKLGDKAVRVGAGIGLAVGLLSHGTFSGKALSLPVEMIAFVDESRASVRSYLWQTYTVDTTPEKKAEKEEEKEEEEEEIEEPEEVEEVEDLEEPIDTPPPEEEPQEELYDEPPPTPAEASKVLTSDDEVLDFSDEGFVTGNNEDFTYGQISAKGKGDKPEYSKNAKVGGTPGGKGTGDPSKVKKPKKPAKNLSKPPGLLGSTSWNCPFPPEADVEQIDQAVAMVVVTVRPDGSPSAVRVVQDPGYGFGRQARICALSKRYKSGLDKDGQPTTMSTPPITVRFTR